MDEVIEREKVFDAIFGQFCASSDETEASLNAAIEEIRGICQMADEMKKVLKA